jgi:Ca-activated chloride channel family protein
MKQAAPLVAPFLAGCEDVRVGHPDSLWLLWLLPLLLAFYLWSFLRRSQLLARFAGPETLPRLLGRVSRSRQRLKAALVLLGVAALALSLAEIKYGFTWEEVRREGVDIVVALDVSDSMLVEDVETGGRLNRLERAKREIADLLDLLDGDRIGLVAFAGTAFVQCPLTLDYNAAAIFLDSIDTDLIPVKGTDIGQAIEKSLSAFEGASHPSRAVILITDGEDHGGRALEAAAAAAAQDVRVFTIGIGREEGSPVPAPGGGLRRTRGGEIILSRLDETTLQKIALGTEGTYVRSVTGDLDLEKIYSQGIKATLEDQELGSSRRQRWQDRYQWILAVALGALMLEPLIGEQRPRSRSRSRSGLPPLALLAALGGFAALPGEAPAATSGEAEHPDPWSAYAAGAYEEARAGFLERKVERPEEIDLEIGAGAASYKLGEWEVAARAFESAAATGDPRIRAEALYNLGNTAYRLDRLEEAIELYRSALDLAPHDRDAKFNLEFARRELDRRNQERQQEDDRESGEDGEPGEPSDGSEPQTGEGEQPSAPEAPNQGPDSDRDGLPDTTEQSAENPTDPRNPDSDGDGLADGQEDVNRNGRVDPGETDPNNADSDGDGVADGEDADSLEQPGQTGEATPGEAPLSMEDALRYLAALQEGRPDLRPPEGTRTVRSGKDW